MCCFFYHSCKTKGLIYQSTDFTQIKRKHSVKYEAHFSNAIHTSHLSVKSLKGFKHWLLHCFLLFCGFFYSTTESTCSRCLSFRLCCFKKPKMKTKTPAYAAGSWIFRSTLLCLCRRRFSFNGEWVSKAVEEQQSSEASIILFWFILLPTHGFMAGFSERSCFRHRVDPECLF